MILQIRKLQLSHLLAHNKQRCSIFKYVYISVSIGIGEKSKSAKMKLNK